MTGARLPAVTAAPTAGADPNCALSTAKKLRAAGDIEGGLATVLAALDSQADHPGLIHEAARSECDLGRMKAGSARVDKALRSHPFDPALLALAARIAHFTGDQEQALRLLARRELVDPYEVSASVLQARVLTAMGREAEAWETLADAQRVRPASPALLINLARRVSDAISLEAFYRRWAANVAKPIDFATLARPLASACLKARAFDRALDTLRRAILIVCDSPAPVQPKVRHRTLGRDGGRALVDVVDRLTAHGTPHFLAAGTVLGLVREGALLSFDNDIDIGIHEKDFDRARLIEMFATDPNFRVQDIDLKSPKVGLQHWNGVSVDLFNFYSENGRVWHAGAFTRWWNTPFELQPVEAYGRTMLAPAPTELYLAECYGDWRTPNPEFDAFFEGPNAEITWPDYFNVYLHRRVFELMSQGQVDRAQRYIHRFSDTFAWLAVPSQSDPATGRAE